jgi:tetratricopeptide (TPR) repeat protein
VIRPLSLALLFVVACDAKTPSAPPAPADAVAVERKLCAEIPPPGAEALDVELAAAAAKALAAPRGLGPEPWVKLGVDEIRKARRSGDGEWYLRAAACAEVALDLDKGNAPALSLLALAALNNHDFRAARDRARAALASDDQLHVAWGVLSDALVELGDLEGATDAAQRMVDLKPNLPSYTRASYLMWARGDVEGAKKVVREAFKSGRDPRDPEPRAYVLTQAADYFLLEGDLKGADAGYDLALEALPDYPAALVGKARVRLGRGEAKAAVPLLEKAEAARHEAEPLALLAQARAAAGDDAGAKRAEAKLLKERRSDSFIVGRFLGGRGAQLEEAVRLLEKEKAARPSPWVMSALAFAKKRAGHDDAEAVLQSVPSTIPDPRLWLERGYITGDAGLMKRALDTGALDPDLAALARAALP